MNEQINILLKQWWAIVKLLYILFIQYFCRCWGVLITNGAIVTLQVDQNPYFLISSISNIYNPIGRIHWLSCFKTKSSSSFRPKTISRTWAKMYRILGKGEQIRLQIFRVFIGKKPKKLCLWPQFWIRIARMRWKIENMVYNFAQENFSLSLYEKLHKLPTFRWTFKMWNQSVNNSSLFN